MALRLKQYPPVSLVRSLLDYDPDTGHFTWRVSRQGVIVGRPAGSLNKTTGYWQIVINGQNCQAHRLAWLHVHGVAADGLIDHANLDKIDNRLCNLRVATPTQQNANQSLRSSSRSGAKGVCWNRAAQRWQAQIKVKGKTHYLGLFQSVDEAAAAYAAAAVSFYGEFARAA